MKTFYERNKLINYEFISKILLVNMSNDYSNYNIRFNLDTLLYGHYEILNIFSKYVSYIYH